VYNVSGDNRASQDTSMCLQYEPELDTTSLREKLRHRLPPLLTINTAIPKGVGLRDCFSVRNTVAGRDT
jgi:hypothetical protein